MSIVPVFVAYTSICPSVIVLVRPIVRIAHRGIIPSVRRTKHQRETNGRPGKISMEGSIDIMSVIVVYEPPVVAIEPAIIVIHV